MNSKYGPEVDVYSMSLIFYEMFSGKLAFANMNAHQLLMAVCFQKRRPDFDATFPTDLKEKISLGWSHEDKDRCRLDEFLPVLLAMKNPKASGADKQVATMGETIRVSMVEQATVTQSKSLAYSSIIDMQWPTQNDRTKASIRKMITEMRKSSSFTKIISETIVNAMLQVPKHCFVDMKVFKEAMKITDENECLKTIYLHAQALRTSQTQNMSSTEITAAQLSFIPLNSGDRVLFLGAKGGYIQTIAAQIVGFQGQIWLCSQDKQGLEHVQNVLKSHVPVILRQLIRCVSVSNIQDANLVRQALEEHSKPMDGYFNAIHVCGAIQQESLENFQQLLKIEGQLLAPINIDEKNQRFTILHKTRDPQSNRIELNKRVLNDWGIIFGPVL